jgi:FKBP-type peptidyl-prolyl cis-trans isomerase (trigger factor)
LEGYGLQTVEEFRQQLKSDIHLRKEEKKRQAVFEAFMNSVNVLQYPEAELNEYIETYQKDSKDLAEQLGISYEEYLREYLGTDLATFQALALSDAQERVKEDMACIQVSRLLGVTLTEEEYAAGLQEFYDLNSSSGNYESLEKFEEYHTRKEIEGRLLWIKALDEMVRTAVRLEG